MTRIWCNIPWLGNNAIAHCSLVMPYGNIGLGRHVACCLRDTDWTNVDLTLMRLSVTHLRLILQEVLKISIHKMSLKSTLIKLLPHLPVANKLMMWNRAFMYQVQMFYGPLTLRIATPNWSCRFSGVRSRRIVLVSFTRGNTLTKIIRAMKIEQIGSAIWKTENMAHSFKLLTHKSSGI